MRGDLRLGNWRFRSVCIEASSGYRICRRFVQSIGKRRQCRYGAHDNVALAWFEFWAPWHPGIDAVDNRAAALAHYESIGIEVPDFEARMLACLLHIGLGHQGYNAWAGDVDVLHAITKRMLSFAG